jgi:hypothetical protein
MNRPAPLVFEQGEDGRWRAGPYTLSPGRVGFGIEVMEIFRDGVHLHRTAGKKCLPDAIAWVENERAEAALPGAVTKAREVAAEAGQASLL